MLKGEVNIGDKVYLRYQNKVVTVKDIEIEEYEMPHGSHSIIKIIDNITVDFDGTDRKIYIEKDYYVLSKRHVESKVNTLKEQLNKYESALEQM